MILRTELRDRLAQGSPAHSIAFAQICFGWEIGLEPVMPHLEITKDQMLHLIAGGETFYRIR